jgi:hypothetical protein
MSVALDELVDRVTAAVPALGGVPDAAQVGQCVADAVADYSRRRPMQKMSTISVVSGTAAYALPSDFVRLIQIESPNSPDGVIVGAGKLIPVGTRWSERYTIAGGQISFYPTPSYSMVRDLWYAAGHVLNGSEDYPDMSGEDAGLVLLKASALALALQANAAAGKAWTYQVGDERVDKTKQAESLRNQAKSLEEQYLAGIKAAIGPVGLRGNG